MKTGLFRWIKTTFAHKESLSSLERQMAKRWVKQRLMVVFPELRNNPAALERAYQELGLAPREGRSEEEAETVFEMSGRVPEQE